MRVDWAIAKLRSERENYQSTDSFGDMTRSFLGFAIKDVLNEGDSDVTRPVTIELTDFELSIRGTGEFQERSVIRLHGIYKALAREGTAPAIWLWTDARQDPFYIQLGDDAALSELLSLLRQLIPHITPRIM